MMVWKSALAAASLFSSSAIGAVFNGASQAEDALLRRAGAVDLASTNASYEYVVVGSGAGGGPLAARLALAGHSVLLIEAGENKTDSYQYNVPALHAVSTEYDEMRWDYYVRHFTNDEQQRKDSKLVYTLPDGSRYWGADPPEGAEILGVLYPRAGTYGGCTAHNAMVTIYPNEIDWTNMVAMTGDDTWNPDNMRKYWQSVENNHYLPSSITGHGFSGWLETSLTKLSLILQDLKLISLVVAAATGMGQGILGSIITSVTGLGEVLLRDINNDNPGRDSSEGLYQVPIAVKTSDHKRSSVVDFLESVIGETNNDGTSKYTLDIAFNTLVTKVVLDTSSGTPRATGVDFMAGKSLYSADPRYQDASGTVGHVEATREVIVSAGTFNTPQLLKLSGIGPRDELDSFGIDVKVNLPGVGKNLQDRYEVPVIGRAPTDISLIADCTFLEGNDPCLNQYLTDSVDQGVYTTNGVAIAVLKKSAVAEDDTTDLLVAGWPVYFNGYYPNYFTNATKEKNAWSWVTLKAHTRNTNGTVTLRSTDPREVPDINFRNFDVGGAEDIAAMTEATKYSRQVFEDLIPLNGKFTEVWPGPSVQTDQDWSDFITAESWGHHACCTAAIGADGDENAVLDTNFKVRGVDSLRVVDASVFPKIPGYFIAAPIYMISEKASDVILADAV